MRKKPAGMKVKHIRRYLQFIFKTTKKKTLSMCHNYFLMCHYFTCTKSVLFIKCFQQTTDNKGHKRTNKTLKEQTSQVLSNMISICLHVCVIKCWNKKNNVILENSMFIWKWLQPDLVSIAITSERSFPYWDYGHDNEAVSYDV